MPNFMNLFRAPEAKASRTSQVLAFESGGRARWTPRDYAGLAREGYLANAIVHRAVRMIAENAASCGFLLYEGTAERDAHPLMRLLTKPNARQDGASFFETLYAHMLLAGNAYIEAVALDDQVRELHVLRPDRMKVVPGHDGWPEAYDYSVGARGVRFDQSATRVPPILHLTYFHPLDDHYGLAPIEAAAVAVDAAIHIGVLDTALTAPPPSPAEGERYVVATGATGAWSGHAGAIATYEDATWRFLAPKLGWCVWSAADEVLFVYDGDDWRDLRDLPVGLDTLTHLGINATASSPNLLSVKSNAVLFDAIPVSGGGNGDARLQISKEGSAHTASVVFSDAFSGRAEFGLVGSDAFKLKVSHDGATFTEALTVDQATGNIALQRGVLLTGVIAPSQITSNQNDYAPTGLSSASVLRISTDASRNITGLAGGAEGRKIIVVNAGTNPAVLKDESTSSTAANRFGFGSDLTLAAKQGATLIYDGNASRWRQIGGPSASGSAGGATDSERQNTLLGLIYQSKAFGGYRRLVALFADGFKASDGINAGSSSNYMVTTASGYVSPSSSTTDTLPAQTMTGDNAGWTGYGCRQLIPASSLSTSGTIATVTFTGPSSGSALVVSAAYIGPSGTAPNFSTTPVQLKVGGSGSFTVPVGGTVTTDPVSYTLNHTVDQIVSIGVTSGDFRVKTSATGFSRYYKASASGDASSTSVSGYSNTASELQGVSRISVGSGANNMTLVTTTQTADSSVSTGRVLLEYDNSATPVLNTDLTVEVTCNGGTNWTAATLSAVTSYSQGGRKAAETADASCTSGTSFAARIKTFNNKDVKIHGATLAVR